MKRDYLYYAGAVAGLALMFAPLLPDRVLLVGGQPFTVLLCIPGVALASWSVVAGAEYDRSRTACRGRHPVSRKKGN